jgi:hypothetical protein
VEGFGINGVESSGVNVREFVGTEECGATAITVGVVAEHGKQWYGQADSHHHHGAAEPFTGQQLGYVQHLTA